MTNRPPLHSWLHQKPSGLPSDSGIHSSSEPAKLDRDTTSGRSNRWQKTTDSSSQYPQHPLNSSITKTAGTSIKTTTDSSSKGGKSETVRSRLLDATVPRSDQNG